MHTIQNKNQEKHSLNSHISKKSLRFTVALCAAAVLAGGVAYAAPVETVSPANQRRTAEATFTDTVATYYEEKAFLSENQIAIDALVDPADISIAVIDHKVTVAQDDKNHIPSGWPLESRIVSTEFNPTGDRSISDGRKHEGMDISTRSQIIPIHAAASGTVVTANYHRQYGYQVIIDHGNGYTTLYAHCNELLVEAGDEVKKGDTIATTGSSGWSTGIHLHYEVMLNGVHQNPRDYL